MQCGRFCVSGRNRVVQQTVERQKQEAMRQELLAEDDDVAAFERELAGEVESDAPAGVEGAGAVAGGLLETGEPAVEVYIIVLIVC